LKRYEAMFLFDNAAFKDWSDVESEVRRLCDRIGAQLQVCVKFDERKLAYEIRGRKRGTYVLTYFDAPPQRIADLERDARLSEMILRHLVLRAHKMTDEALAELRKHPADKPLIPHGADGRHGESRAAGGRRAAESAKAAAREPAKAAAQEAKAQAAAARDGTESASEEPTGGSESQAETSEQGKASKV